MAEENSTPRAGGRSPDQIDSALLAALQEEGRQRLEDLARRVGLAPSSVHDRLRRLRRDGVIRRWTIEVAPEALGLTMLAYIGVRASVPCSTLVEAITQMPEVEEFHSVAGQLSFIVKVRATSSEHLLALTERLRQIPGIEGTETTVVLKTHLERGPHIAPGRHGA
ncbi:MAG TPA: Lrp/AsnC family transcriptional regulator [Ktedonobacterales bacterium]